MGHYQKMEESLSFLIFSHMCRPFFFVFVSTTLSDTVGHKNRILCHVSDDVV